MLAYYETVSHAQLVVELLHPLASVAGGFGVDAGVRSQDDLGSVLRDGDRPGVHVGQRPGPDQRPRVFQVTLRVLTLLLLLRVGVPEMKLQARRHYALVYWMIDVAASDSRLQFT